jgi:hypothetical protein
MGYRPSSVETSRYTAGAPVNDDELQVLKNQKEILENQLRNLQESLSRIERRLDEIQNE